MSTFAPFVKKIVYPESDGQPMAENPVQARWIVTIHGNLDAIFQDRPDVLVAMDHFWYPVEGRTDIRTAPDVYVAFGVAKGDRPSFKQWEEGGVAPQIVFEILSPSNRGGEMARKFGFYEQYGVDEYYLYDPDDASLTGFRRSDDRLVEIPDLDRWVSPRLGIQFDLSSGPEMVIYRPDGRRFHTFLELNEKAERTDQETRRAEQERARAEQEKHRADQERERADQERQRTEFQMQRAELEKLRAELEKQRAETERQRAERLAAMLRAAGIDPGS